MLVVRKASSLLRFEGKISLCTSYAGVSLLKAAQIRKLGDVKQVSLGRVNSSCLVQHNTKQKSTIFCKLVLEFKKCQHELKS